MTSTPSADFEPPGLNSAPLGYYSSTAKEMKAAGFFTGVATTSDESDDEESPADLSFDLEVPGAFAKKMPRRQAPVHGLVNKDLTVLEMQEVEKLKVQGKYLIAKIMEEIVVSSGSSRKVVVKWLGYEEPSTIDIALLPEALRLAWDQRPHKNTGRIGQFDTALYVCEMPPGMFGHSQSRHFNIYDKGEQLPEEMEAVYGSDDTKCDTEKDKQASGTLHSGGIMYAVGNCGIVYMARELWR